MIDKSAPEFTKYSIDKAKEYLDLVKESDKKYLIRNPAYRDIFIERLEKEIENIRNTETFGFLPQKESDEFKEYVLGRLSKIVNINKNYEYAFQPLEEEWERIKNLEGKNCRQ